MAEWMTYALVMGANLCFASATLIFSHFSKKVSILWMNTLKATVATVLFALTTTFLGLWEPVAWTDLLWLGSSGLIGLCLADIFMLKAFTILGPGRTLILFSFQPILLGLAGYFLFGQSISYMKMISILFMIGCLLVFVQERKQMSGKWNFSGFIEAFVAMLFDTTGIILTRVAYEHSHSLAPAPSNFYRAVGALIGFFVLNFTWKKVEISANFNKLENKEKILALFGCFFGCYLSLMLYLTALKYSHLASASALSITGPLFAASFECIIHKTKPSKYLIGAFVLFIMGVIVLSLS